MPSFDQNLKVIGHRTPAAITIRKYRSARAGYTGNSASNGGVIYAETATVTVVGGSYISNNSTGNGGAINLGKGTLIVDNSTIVDGTAASGKGIIDQLIAEEGLEIPHIDRICGTANGRVKVYFADSSEKINCPLDYLRSRFLRRFGKRKTK